MTVLEVLDRAKQLSPNERKQLLKLLIDTLDLPSAKESSVDTHSILELAGLGAEIWKGIDAQQYVDQLRDEWYEQS